MYAVIFSSVLSEDDSGYSEAAERMVALCSRQPGFLEMESVRGDDGHGLTICYWESLEAIEAWRRNAEHAAARAEGSRWYERYRLTVCEVLRDG